MAQQRDWIWRDEQPAAIVLVVLVLALVLFFPRQACRGETTASEPRLPAQVTAPDHAGHDHAPGSN